MLHFASLEVLTKLAPAVAGAVVFWSVTNRIRSPWALPAVLLVMPTAFFAALYAVGSDVEAARHHGWFQAKVGACNGLGELSQVLCIHTRPCRTICRSFHRPGLLRVPFYEVCAADHSSVSPAVSSM